MELEAINVNHMLNFESPLTEKVIHIQLSKTKIDQILLKNIEEEKSDL